MTYLYFLIAEDGRLNFGARMPYPAGMSAFPDTGPLYSVKAVDAAFLKLAERTFPNEVLPAALAGKAAGLDRPGTWMLPLLPHLAGYSQILLQRVALSDSLLGARTRILSGVSRRDGRNS